MLDLINNNKGGVGGDAFNHQGYHKNSFRYCASTFPFICGSRGKHLVISSSYHTNISFIMNSFSYNTMYLSWLATFYSCPPFTMLVWSYHWQSRCPFALMPLREWTYNNPRHTLGYYCNYCFGKWNICLKGSLPPFPSPNLTTSRYSYHQRWLSNFDGRYHYWLNLHRYGAMNIDDNNICNNDDCLGKDIIYVE